MPPDLRTTMSGGSAGASSLVCASSLAWSLTIYPCVCSNLVRHLYLTNDEYTSVTLLPAQSHCLLCQYEAVGSNKSREIQYPRRMRDQEKGGHDEET